ncbi:intraflagellar transport protein 74 homolog isoform X1 [Pocillopora verrucosa]|uniref:intraflagellar transport protein 74 homolog isoform X1 n=2 Tax=Pocillopora verrucosa TaxID=203993 RepID=UPI0027974CE5|nr:intraflagellar transport protein 74 homolog [Pocillopora verrucosa]
MSDFGGGRPPSARGYRPPSGKGMRPGSGARGRMPPSSMGRPPGTAAMRLPPGTGMAPGTARPGSRAGELGGALNAQIRVAERPMTKQGLTGMKTSAGRGPQRAIYDKSFYMGQLRAKITELAAEIAKMQKEVDQFNQENATFLTYEKRAEGLATEIKELQGQLADYNTLLDKINTDTEMDDIVQDFNALKIQNEREQNSIDELFTQRRDKEQQIKQLELELDQERRMAESLVEDMPPDQRAKYAKLKNVNNSLQTELEQKQQDLDALTTRIQNLEDEVSSSPVKQEAVTLYEKLNELGEKKQSLLDEMEKENKGTPAEERERLLKQVKEDNQEIAGMERKTSELREKIEAANGEIQQLDMDLEEHQGERNVKYKELKKREETMDEFLETFEEVKANEQTRKQQLENNIVNVLEHMSRGMARTKHLPSPAELQRMKDDLNFKETEMHKSQSTATSLGSEHTRLQMDLEKVEQLETKITTELESLKERIQTMTQELETFSDLDALRDQSEEKKTRLYGEKKTLSARKETFKKHVQRLSSLYDATKSKLMENETHSQLGNLERKWQHHEQNNFVMKEFIATKSMESDYRPLKQNVSEQLEDINKLLIQSLGK